MVVLVDLPVFVLQRFLQSWCSYVELVKLDSAMCAHKLRDKFLRTIGSDQFILDNKFCHEAPLLKWMLNKGVSVNRLTIDSSFEVARTDLLGKVTKSLNSLFLWHVPHAKQILTRNVLQVSPLLQSIKVYRTILDDAICNSICEYCPNVRELDLESTCMSYDSSQTILQRLTRLTKLMLDYGVFTSAAMLGIAYHCPNLSWFKYDEGCCTDSPTVYLSKTLSNEVLTVICSMCTQLTHLDLLYEWGTRQTMGLSAVYRAIAQRLPLLRLFNISNVNITDSGGLESMFQNLHQLRQLSLDASELSNTGFVQLLYEHPNLRSVSLYCNSIISGQNFADIPLQPNRMKFLHLGKFAALTNDGMRCVLRACHRINNITISGAPLLAPEIVIPLIVQLCPRIKHVYFDECVQFTQAKVNEILTGLDSKLHVGVDGRSWWYQYDKSEDEGDVD